MHPETARILLTGGRFRALGPISGASTAQEKFRSWLNSHRVSVANFAAVSGLSRATVSSLAGAGTNAKWESLNPDKFQQVLRAMNYLTPITERELRVMLGLPEEQQVADFTPHLRDVTLGGVAALRFNLAVDTLDPGAPHVFLGRSGTYVSLDVTDDTRLGRLLSLTPVL